MLDAGEDVRFGADWNGPNVHALTPADYLNGYIHLHRCRQDFTAWTRVPGESWTKLYEGGEWDCWESIYVGPLCTDCLVVPFACGNPNGHLKTVA